MLYILTLIAALELTVLVWYLISYTPKKKVNKPNYSATVDDKLSYGVKLV